MRPLFFRVHQEVRLRELDLRPIMVPQLQDWGNQADYDLHQQVLEAQGLPVLWQVYLGRGPDCQPLVVYPNPTQTQVVELQVHQDQGKTRITKYWRYTECKIKNFSPPLFFTWNQSSLFRVSISANFWVCRPILISRKIWVAENN